MPFGIQILEIYIPLWKLVTSAIFARANFTISSMFYFLQMIRPITISVFQSTTNS